MKIDSAAFRIPPGRKLSLKKWPTRTTPAYKSQQHYQQQVEQIAALRMAYPELDAARRRELREIRKLLAK